MPEHTPGPWHVGFEDDGTFDDTIPVCSGSKPGEMVIACVWAIETEVADESDISRANARLIAAAPDLLAACRIALPSLKELLTGSTEVHDRRCKAVSDIVDAIAKAEGGAD